MRKSQFLPVFLTVALLFFSSCISTNYYTARTLDKGETVITPGLDNLFFVSNEEDGPKKSLGFSPSLGIASGLPARFEAGARIFFPYTLEGMLRYQVNPKTFTWFDLSLNLHSGVIFTERFNNVSKPYFKYGVMISKTFGSFEPYFGYYYNNNYFIGEDDTDMANFTILSFGMSLPIFDSDRIYPEVNYLTNNSSGDSFLVFGLGLRVHLRKQSTK